MNDLTTKTLTQTTFAGLILMAILSGLPSASADTGPAAVLPESPALLDCVVLGLCGPEAIAAAWDDASRLTPDGSAFDCAAVGVCDAIDQALAGVAAAFAFQLVALYQDVYPNGQFGYFDCVYDSATNRSVIVERWGIHVEAGTLNGSTRNPIVNTNVYYPFVDTATGNAC